MSASLLIFRLLPNSVAEPTMTTIFTITNIAVAKFLVPDINWIIAKI